MNWTLVNKFDDLLKRKQNFRLKERRRKPQREASGVQRPFFKITAPLFLFIIVHREWSETMRAFLSSINQIDTPHTNIIGQWKVSNCILKFNEYNAWLATTTIIIEFFVFSLEFCAEKNSSAKSGISNRRSLKNTLCDLLSEFLYRQFCRYWSYVWFNFSFISLSFSSLRLFSIVSNLDFNESIEVLCEHTRYVHVCGTKLLLFDFTKSIFLLMSNIRIEFTIPFIRLLFVETRHKKFIYEKFIDTKSTVSEIAMEWDRSWSSASWICAMQRICRNSTALIGRGSLAQWPS